MKPSFCRKVLSRLRIPLRRNQAALPGESLHRAATSVTGAWHASEGAPGHRAGRRREIDNKQPRGAAFRIVAAVLLLAAMPVALIACLLWPIDVRETSRAREVSTTVLDRDGRLLRAFTTADGHWRLPVTVDDVDPRYLAMLLAYEDRRFRLHSGVDPQAVARAVGLAVRHGRIVSGASTITMQVVRLLAGEHPRTASGKLAQMRSAISLERRLSKRHILDLYLRLAPFGGNMEGVRAASLAYFGHEPRRLSIAEAALLVALPQSPEVRRPDRRPRAARRARDRVLARMTAAGIISREEAAEARQIPVPTARRPFPRLAPHLSDSEVRKDPAQAVVRLTLDRAAQAALERLAAEHATSLGPRLSVAVLAVDHKTGETLAHVGSAGDLDESRLGAIDMVDAVRSPGSTLKPFIYGLAFERGTAHPETLIEDRPTRFGTYQPKNFDEDFRGTVSIREALAQSLNIPAVKVLADVGPGRLVARLRRAGARPVLPVGAEPSLGLALGGVGLTLRDLATLYSALARGGEPIALIHRAGDITGAPGAGGPVRRLLTPVAAWQIGDILKDAPPPAGAKAGRIAYKTGTSYGHRDAWAVGYDGRLVVAVWVGRADGSATPGLSGRTAAAPVLFDAFARLAERTAPLAAPPRGTLRVSSTSRLPPPLRRYKEPGEELAATATRFLDPPVRIAFPPDRAELESEPAGPTEIVLKAENGALPLTWLVDGRPLTVDPDRRDIVWQPDGPGFSSISVIDAKGRSDRIDIRLR